MFIITKNNNKHKDGNPLEHHSPNHDNYNPSALACVASSRVFYRQSLRNRCAQNIGHHQTIGSYQLSRHLSFFLYLDKNFSKLEKIIIKSLQYRRVLLNILQNSTLNKLTNYMLILEKLICTIL